MRVRLAYRETHLIKSVEYVVALLQEQLLQCLLVLLHALRLEQGNGRELRGVRAPAVEVRTGLSESRYQLRRSTDPAATPSRKAEILGQAVDEDDWAGQMRHRRPSKRQPA